MQQNAHMSHNNNFYSKINVSGRNATSGLDAPELLACIVKSLCIKFCENLKLSKLYITSISLIPPPPPPPIFYKL